MLNLQLKGEMTMKKTVVVEYVGIEDVQEIMDDALACIREGHYVLVTMSGHDSVLVSVYVTLNGYKERASDYIFNFNLSDEERDVAEMNKCKNTLKNLLREEE